MWIILLSLVIALSLLSLIYFHVRERIEIDAAQRIRDAHWRKKESDQFITWHKNRNYRERALRMMRGEW